jgi:outer membrane lipoprotein-sorting protein
MLPLGLCVIALSVSSACAEAWAGSIAHSVADGLDRIKSYQGTTQEVGLDDGGAGAAATATTVERKVLYGRPWKVRIETTAPAAHAGELFIYDGETVTLWYPQSLLGIRIHGVHTPDRKAVKAHIEKLTRENLAAYTFALESEHARIAGQRALEWVVRPARKAAFRMTHRVWNHDPSTMPLKMAFYDGKGGIWYGFQYTTITYDVPLAPDAFDFTFPENAIVLEWNLDAPGLTLEEARAQMNFKVMMPKSLPKGLGLNKIVRSPATIPMLLVSFDSGATMLSLSETRAFAGYARPLGKDVVLDDGTHATLSFMGAFSVITWVKDGTLLTLTGNLSFPSMLTLAAQVQAS